MIRYALYISHADGTRGARIGVIRKLARGYRFVPDARTHAPGNLVSTFAKAIPKPWTLDTTTSEVLR